MRQTNRHSIDRNNQNEPENKLQINPETSEDNSKKAKIFENGSISQKLKNTVIQESWPQDKNYQGQQLFKIDTLASNYFLK